MFGIRFGKKDVHRRFSKSHRDHSNGPRQSQTTGTETLRLLPLRTSIRFQKVKEIVFAAFGRGFSLMIHIPSCEKQWVADEQSIGGWGRPLPPRPHQIQSSSLPTTPEDIETFNTEMLIYWEKNTLLECASCGRTFK